MSTVRTDDREGGVRLLTLDRPPANAIESGLLGDLAAALADAREDDSVRAVVLTGAGRFFSAGLDLMAVLSRDAEATRGSFDVFRDALLALLALPKPTVAAVNGHTIAGGLIMALACDFRVGVQGDYVVGLNEVAIGASYPRVALEIVRLRLSHAQAVEVLLGADLYKAGEAPRLGLFEGLVPREEFEATVLGRAARLASFPRAAYAHTKAAFVRPAVERVKAETPQEAAEGAAVWMSPESQAALIGQLRKLGKQAPAGPPP